MMNINPSISLLELKIKLSTEENSKRLCTTVYRSILGKLHYLSPTRPDLMFSVGLSRFMENPSVEHLKTAKRVIRSKILRAQVKFFGRHKVCKRYILRAQVQKE